MASTEILAHSALFASNFLLGVGAVVSKLGLAGCNPVLFALLREAVAAPCLFALSVATEGAQSSLACGIMSSTRRGMSTDDRRQFFTAGILLFGTNLLYIIGVKFLGATAAAIWQSSLPIFTMLISVAVGYELLTILKVIGVLVAFAGCAFVTLYEPSAAAEDSGGADLMVALERRAVQVRGHLVFLVQVVCCAGFFVAEKPLLQRWSPLATLAYSYAIASSFMLCAGILINANPEALDVVCPDCEGFGWRVPAGSLLAIGYWIIFGSVSAYYLATWGNQYVEASMVGVYFTVQPLASIVAALAIIFATAPPHYGLTGLGVQDLGAIPIFLGVALLIHDARLRSTKSDVESRSVGGQVGNGKPTGMDSPAAPPYERLTG